MPKELFGNILPVDQCTKFFKHGAVLEVIMAGRGATVTDGTQAIATGVGICWGKDKNGELIGGWAAEYVEFFPTWIDDEIAESHAKMWLKKSLQHELDLRSVSKHSEFQYFHNYINIRKKFGFCLTALGFLNFENVAPAVIQ
ncbi:pyruvoyl-dependent arginine decarboxylase [Chlamydia trachomatis]|nr:pyruvoyl-dependent arginine decarboxylase [Chlamydia trachomatis]